MSLPQLQQSSTVQLEVDTNRRLRADVVKSPTQPNALQVRSGGLYAKRGRRLYGWSLTSQPVFALQPTLPLALNTNQFASFGLQYADYGDMFDGVAFPTRVTIPEDGKWFQRVTAQIIATTGAFGSPAAASLLVIKNGVQQVSGQWLPLDNTAANGTANAQGYFDAVAGDYLEVAVRFNILTGVTAPGWKFNNVAWGGFKVSA